MALNIPALHGNWIDLVIIVLLIYFSYDSFSKGLTAIVTDLISFFGALVIAFKGYKFVAMLLKENFTLNTSLANSIGFLITAILAEVLISYLVVYLFSKTEKAKPKLNKFLNSTWSKVLGCALGFIEGLVFVAFGLTFIMALPVNPSIKNDISESKIGSLILQKTSGVEKGVNDIFGEVVNNSLTYLTVEPGKKESISLDSKTMDLKVDESAEADMLERTNKERSDRGIAKLTWDTKLVAVGRAHAKDMWQRNYFSHYSPEGEDVGDRLNKAKITYMLAGENLALAPTTSVAQNGLMNSEGHRANILEPKFKKVGIGVVSNGYYGLMIVEVFTD